MSYEELTSSHRRYCVIAKCCYDSSEGLVFLCGKECLGGRGLEEGRPQTPWLACVLYFP